MKSFLKSAARFVALVLTFPLFLSWRVRASLLGRDLALEGSSELVSLLPGLTGSYLRSAFYSLVLQECHPSARICFGTLFSKADSVIGENVYIGPRCHLGWVILEQDVLLAPGVHVPSGPHTHGTSDPDRPIREQPGRSQVVRIGAGSWIGANAVIMADVGANCVVGAGAIVTRPLPDGVVAVGAPARVIQQRFATVTA
ncbi:acyltransferase [Planctellipticum variicoloris]|uniref:acyltransferase n=1 Tax=Planctellipticum variicoloris TaxID=3064265 RepID=UPI0030132DA9|nr:acyltransferase [Planctomycetaceae bacterium SH412]